MTTLLEISDDLLALGALLEESDGELSPETAAALDSWFAELQTGMETKLDNYGALLREWELRASARQAEIDRLQVRVRVDQANVKRLKDRLLMFLDAHGTSRVETERYKFICCANGGKQPMQTPDVKELPPSFTRVKQEADNEKIRAALEAGQEIPGCRLLERGRHLQVR